GERPVAINRYHDRDDQPLHLLLVRASVELLAELHDVDLRLAQRRTHRRRRRRLASGDLQLYETCNFLCHDLSLPLKLSLLSGKIKPRCHPERDASCLAKDLQLDCAKPLSPPG